MSITVEFDQDVEEGIQKYMSEMQVSHEEAVNTLLRRGLSGELEPED